MNNISPCNNNQQLENQLCMAEAQVKSASKIYGYIFMGRYFMVRAKAYADDTPY